MSPLMPVRWGIVATANIARRQFLPALAEAGGGRAVLVGGRDRRRAEDWAEAEGVERGVEGYEAVVTSPEIDAVYVALPNTFHAEWTLRALEAGKAVLCEKLLCPTAAEAAPVLEAARRSNALLWEAFVFPFQSQHARLLSIAASGEIGEVVEIVTAFHFRVTQPGNIRLAAELGGGALADVGCYPVRLAQELYGAAPAAAGDTAGGGTAGGDTARGGTAGAAGLAPAVWCCARRGPSGVDVDSSAIVDWGERRLVFSVSFGRAFDTHTRVLGTTGQITLTNPYHPGRADTLAIHPEGGEARVEHPTLDERSFTATLRHIHRVLAGEEQPRHLAVHDTAATLRVLDALQTAWRGEPA
ncbi:MAG TPA: Gfo/Idh/MocA family oxidoreductase [Acidimicrobiales bacterium]|nr:Gfo/Idh/MocA family oxidoreductase [Acidimicrobiales bacterium]